MQEDCKAKLIQEVCWRCHMVRLGSIVQTGILNRIREWASFTFDWQEGIVRCPRDLMLRIGAIHKYADVPKIPTGRIPDHCPYHTEHIVSQGDDDEPGDL